MIPTKNSGVTAKKAVSLLAAALLAAGVFAGCNKKPAPTTVSDGGEDVAMGRYIEEQWELPEEVNAVSALHRLPDGKIALLGYKVDESQSAVEQLDYRYFTTEDGKSWAEESPAWLEELRGVAAGISTVHFNAKGEGAVLFYSNVGSYINKVALVSPEGELTVTPIGEGENPLKEEGATTFRINGGSGTFSGSLIEEDDSPEEEAEGEGGANAMTELTPGVAVTSPEEDSASVSLEVGEEVSAEEATADAEPANAEEIVGLTFPVDAMYIDQVYMGEDGLVHLSSGNSAGAFDPATGQLVGEPFRGVSALTVVGEQLACLRQKSVAEQYGIPLDDHTVSFLENGRETRTQPTGFISDSDQPGLMSANNALLAGGEDGSLYLSESSGLYRLAAGGESWERIVDGGLSSLSLPSIYPISLLPHSGEQFLLLCYSGEKPQLLNYRYSQDTPTLPDTELTVYALKADATLSQAVGAFRKTNPNVLVNIRTARDEEEGISDSDAIRSLNTELLAGKGPDLLLLDGLPIQSYIEKGVLADLSDVIDPLVQEGKLLENIVTSLGGDSGLFAVPSRFNLPTVWGEKEAVAAADSLESLIDYAEKNPDKRLLGDLSPDRLLFDFGRACRNSFQTESGAIDVDALENFYTLIKRLSDTADGAPRISGGKQDTDAPTRYDESFWNAKELGNMESVRAIFAGQVDLMTANLAGFTDVMMPNSAAFRRNGGGPVNMEDENATTTVPDSEVTKVFRLQPGTENGVFYPVSVIGVNAAGEQQDLAKEFVQALLSAETQSADMTNGFPVNREAAGNLANRNNRVMAMASTYVTDGDEYDTPVIIEATWPSKALLTALTERFGSLTAPVVENQDTKELIGMIIDESRAFFDGSASARQAAEAVAERTRIRLAE